MKTAREWYKDEYFNISDISAGDFYILCQRIQLDAMREGMRRAAKIRDNTAWNQSTAILTAAEQLTEKDLG